MALSKRLQWMYDHLLPHHDVWDFCCDHGYLGEAALDSDLFPKVYFVDQVPHIISRLEQKLSSKKNFERASFLKCNGEAVNTLVAGTVVIAGVGGHTIRKILEHLQRENLLQPRRLILSPQRDEEMLRDWISQKVQSQERFLGATAEHFIFEGKRKRCVFLLDFEDSVNDLILFPAITK